MAIHHNPHDMSLAVLKDSKNRSSDSICKALHDLRHNAGLGDEEFIFPLLDHEDCYVVAWALFTLWHTYGRQKEIEPLVKRLAWGDPRDFMEMPLQSMAISLLQQMAPNDLDSLAQLLAIGEDASIHEVPRHRAWEYLAEIYGVEWLKSYAEEMIWSPESEKSEAIRSLVRQAIQQKGI